MIDLTLRCSVEGVSHEPFVVRLFGGQRPRDELLFKDDYGAEYIGLIAGRSVYSAKDGLLAIDHACPSDLDGDVLFVEPSRERCQRWIRAASRHNTLLITERCDQLCIMCSQPPRQRHRDRFSHFETACLLAPASAVIGLSGGEPLLFKDQVFSLIERLYLQRPDLRFHVLTNGQHFERSDLSQLAHRPLRLVLWGVPIYAAEASAHDSIVRKPGALARLEESLGTLLSAGAGIELRTVLLQQNVAELPRLAWKIAAQLVGIDRWAIMQLEHAGFARSGWRSQFVDHSEDFGPVAEAVAIAESRGISVALYNFPRCTVPEAFRHLAADSISDWKKRYTEVCTPCRERALCTGVFEWHPDRHHFKGIQAL
jgi:His-Xaa-Ser system radical SAM maturase HxsC